MTFLKQLGLDILKGVQIIAGFAPYTSALLPAAAGAVATGVSDLQKIASVITMIEAAGAAITPTMTGPQKLAAATPGVTQAFLASTIAIGKGEPANPALFATAMTELTQAIVDVLNSYKPDSIVKTTP